MIKSMGIRAHDYGKMSSYDLANAIKKDGMASAQLALNKAILGIETINDELTSDQLIKIGQDFETAKVDIAVLGCYLNYAHPDQSIREKNISVFKKHIAYAKPLKARVVGTETGSLNPDYSYNRDNHSKEAYDTFARSLYELLEVAEEAEVNLAIEGVWDHIIYDNKRMLELIKDMKSDRLKVILDPVNLLNSHNYKEHDDIVKASFDLFGDRIQIIHAKDYQVKGKEILEVSHGSGLYDYKLLTQIANQAPEAIDILLENGDVSNISNILDLF